MPALVVSFRHSVWALAVRWCFHTQDRPPFLSQPSLETSPHTQCMLYLISSMSFQSIKLIITINHHTLKHGYRFCEANTRQKADLLSRDSEKKKKTMKEGKGASVNN